MACTIAQTSANNGSYGLHPSPSNDDVTCWSDTSGYQRFVTALQTAIVAVISAGIILSNVVNLIVLASASAAMPWATRLFLINLSSSDLLVGLVACAPAVLPAATHRWAYGDAWCQVSGVAHGTSCTVSIWSISMVGLHRFVARSHSHSCSGSQLLGGHIKRCCDPSVRPSVRQ